MIATLLFKYPADRETYDRSLDKEGVHPSGQV